MSLREWLTWLKGFIRERYVQVVLSVLFIFIFPDYTAPAFAILALILAFLETRKKGKHLFASGLSGKYLWFFIAFIAVSIIYSVNRRSSVLTLLMWLSMFTAYIAIVSVINTPERFKRMMQLITLGMGFMGAVACVQFLLCYVFKADWGYLHFWTPLDNLVMKFFPLNSYTSDLRASSTFMNPNIFAEVMVCLVPMSFYAIGKAEHQGTRNLFILCAFIGVVGTALSFSRASYFCFLILLILVMVFLLPRFSRHDAILLIAVVAVGLLFLFLTPNIFINRIKTISTGDDSIMDRINEWKAALTFIKASPIFGYGAGNGVTQQLMSSVGMNFMHAHNLYIELLIEGGLVGFISFFIPVAMCAKNQFVTMLKEKKNRLLGFCVTSSLLMILLFGITDYPLLTPKLVGLFVLLFAISDSSVYLFDDDFHGAKHGYYSRRITKKLQNKNSSKTNNH